MSHHQTLELYLSGALPPSYDLAFETWLVERAASGKCCAFVTSWDAPVVVLGYAQAKEDVDLEWCRKRGIPVLRRITGGTGVIHHRDLSLCLALPSSHPWARGIVALYDRFLGVLEPALQAAGGAVGRLEQPERAKRDRSPICFEDLTADTLLSGGKKVVGCAQTRRAHAVLIHAAILLGVDAELYARVFGVSEERVRNGLGAAVPEGDPRRLSAEVVRSLAGALDLDVRPEGLPDLEERFLAPYATEKWAPVPVGIR